MSRTILQIHWYFDTVTGEYAHRIGFPSRFLNHHSDFRVVNCHVFHPQLSRLAVESDLVILHMIYQPEFQQLLFMREKTGRPTLFEMADNVTALGPWVKGDHPLRTYASRQTLLNLARNCQGIQFSSKVLQDKFRSLNSQSRLFKNQVETSARPEKAETPFIFGWGGSHGHFEDLKTIAPIIKDFCRKHSDCRFLFMGSKPQFDDIFGDLPETQREYWAAGPIESYYRFLDNLHVGLAPLEPTLFNACRSDVKFLEYASHGVGSLLADAPQYREHGARGQRARIFRNPEELYQLLDFFYNHRSALDSLSETAYRYVQTHRSHKAYGKRIPFYTDLLKSSIPVSTDIFENLMDGSSAIEGMREAQRSYFSGNLERAYRMFVELKKSYPDYDLAELWIQKTLSKMKRHDKILERPTPLPSSMYSDLINQEKYWAYENRQEANLFLDRIKNPWRRLKLMQDEGHKTEAWYHEVLRENPFDYDALTELARIFIRQKTYNRQRHQLRNLLQKYYPEKKKWQKWLA